VFELEPHSLATGAITEGGEEEERVTGTLANGGLSDYSEAVFSANVALAARR
jgi:hypothetical protein